MGQCFQSFKPSPDPRTTPSHSWGVAVAVMGTLCVTPDALLLRLMERRVGASTFHIFLYKSVFRTLWIGLYLTVVSGWGALGALCRPGARLYILAGAILLSLLDLALTTAFLATLVARAFLFYLLNPLWSALLGTLAFLFYLLNPLWSALLGTLAFLFYLLNPLWSALLGTLAFLFYLLNPLWSALLGTLAFLFYLLNPLWSALLGRIFLKDRIETRTLWALGGALLSVFVAYAPAALDIGSPLDNGATIYGDMMAFAGGVLLSIYMILCRNVSRKEPQVMFNATILTGFICVGLGMIGVLVQGDALAISEPLFWPLSLVDGLCLALALVAFTIAPRAIPAAEVSMLSLIQMPLAPLLVYVAGMGAVPDPYTIAAAVVLLFTLLLHNLAAMRKAPTTPTPDAVESKALSTLNSQQEQDTSRTLLDCSGHLKTPVELVSIDPDETLSSAALFETVQAKPSLNAAPGGLVDGSVSPTQAKQDHEAVTPVKLQELGGSDVLISFHRLHSSPLPKPKLSHAAEVVAAMCLTVAKPGLVMCDDTPDAKPGNVNRIQPAPQA
eukprot:g28205.t1